MLQKSLLGRRTGAERAQQVVVLGWVVQQVQVFPLDLDVPTGCMRCLGPEPRAMRCSERAQLPALGPPRCGIGSDMARVSPEPCWAGRHCLAGLHLALMLPCLELNPSEGILLLPVLKLLTSSF